MERKVGVVGAGITGAALAHLLQQEAVKRSLKVVPEVVVWEKNNIAGGRMMARFVCMLRAIARRATMVFLWISSRRSFRKNRVVHVDIGAQYLTTFTSDNDDVRTPLSNQKLLATLDASSIAQDTRRRAPLPQTICPQELGFRAIVESLLKGETYCVGLLGYCGDLTLDVYQTSRCSCPAALKRWRSWIRTTSNWCQLRAKKRS